MLGLGHSSLTAIMNGARNREVTYIPQSDDKAGIKAVWPSI